jgi:nitrous oxide reductase accessory protein NosL
MKSSSLQLAGIAAASLALAGCTNTVVKIEEAIPCPVAAATLTEHCAEPQQETNGSTYQDVIKTALLDRTNLKKCSAHDELLINAITACNDILAKHNEAIRAINQKYANKP